jgi:hypothetical protein
VKPDSGCCESVESDDCTELLAPNPLGQVKTYRSLKEAPSVDQWLKYMQDSDGPGFTHAEAIDKLLVELREIEGSYRNAKTDKKEYRGLVDLCLAFYWPLPSTDSPFGRIKLKWAFALMPPKLQSSTLVGLCVIVLMICLTLDLQKTSLDSVDEQYTNASVRYDWLSNSSNGIYAMLDIVNVTDPDTASEGYQLADDLLSVAKDDKDFWDDIYEPLDAGFSTAVILSTIFCAWIPCGPRNLRGVSRHNVPWRLLELCSDGLYLALRRGLCGDLDFLLGAYVGGILEALL